jgi:hypothetical protein
MAVNYYQNFADGLAAFMALQPNSTAIRYALFASPAWSRTGAARSPTMRG